MFVTTELFNYFLIKYYANIKQKIAIINLAFHGIIKFKFYIQKINTDMLHEDYYYE